MALPDIPTMMRELIAIPSVSSVHPDLDQGNLAVVERLAEWLRELHFAVEILDVPGHPGHANLVATLGQGSDGLILAGHTDTVPFDAARWNHDPFALKDEDNRWYGLGTTDMKGFFPLVLEAVRELDPATLRHPLVVLATADEESGMAGARALVDSGRRLGRYAVIGEPTGLRPIRLHKGMLMEAIRLTGRAGHSSDPALGNNALEGMHRVIGEILAWRTELQRQYHDPRFAVPVPTLNLGHIHGGDNPNRICGECELQIDIRPLPGMPLDELRSEMSTRLQQVLAHTGLDWETVSLFAGTEAMETDAGSAIVTATERLTGHRAEAAAFGTEGPYLNALGMDTVILGPGDIDQAHQPDEYLGLERIAPTVALLQNLIREFCLEGV